MCLEEGVLEVVLPERGRKEANDLPKGDWKVGVSYDVY